MIGEEQFFSSSIARCFQLGLLMVFLQSPFLNSDDHSEILLYESSEKQSKPIVVESEVQFIIFINMFRRLILIFEILMCFFPCSSFVDMYFFNRGRMS